MLTEHQKHWGVDQWASFLGARELPSMPRSKLLLSMLEEEKGELLAAKELADIVSGDPFLCLRLLRAAEARRSQRLGRDTTTPLAAVLQLGATTFRDLLMHSPETDDSNLGLLACESRAVLASQLAVLWSSARADIAPQEIGLATLLAETGELLLWAFAPELPEQAYTLLESGRVTRSLQAQDQACGFKFRDLTQKCTEIWQLPALVAQLIRGVDNIRANISRLSIDTARHLASGSDNPALPSDLAEAHKLIPQASMEWLASKMIGLDEEHQAHVVELANEILANSKAA